MSDTTRRITIASGTVARLAIVVVAVVAVGNLLWLGRDALFLAVLACLVALYLSFFADFLVARTGLRRGWAAALVLALSVGLFVLLFWLLWPTLRDQLSTVREQLPVALDRVSVWARGVVASMGAGAAGPAPDVEQQLQTRLRQELNSAVSGALPLFNTMMGAIFGVFVVIAAGTFMAADPVIYRNGFVRLLPKHVRPRVAEALSDVGHSLRGWMVGTGISMSIIGVATTLALWAIQLPGFVALGVMAGLFQFIPTIGPIISAVPAIALALVVAPTKVLWVILLYALIQLVETNLLTPLIMKKQIHVPPALSLLAQAFMAIVFGFFGLLLAVPIVAALLVLVQRLYLDDVENAPPTAPILPPSAAG